MAFDESQNYLNALVFSMFVKAISVLILGMFVFSFVKPYVVFLLTLEIVLIAILIYSLYVIGTYEKKQKDIQKKLMEAKVLNPPCPDYFVRSVDEDGALTCKGEYITPDGGLKYTFKPNVLENLSESQELEMIENGLLPNGMDTSEIKDYVPSISAGKMFEGKSLNSVCDTYFSNDGLFKQIPYSGMKPVCGTQDVFE